MRNEENLILEDIAKDLEVEQDNYYSAKDRINRVRTDTMWGMGITRSL